MSIRRRSLLVAALVISGLQALPTAAQAITLAASSAAPAGRACATQAFDKAIRADRAAAAAGESTSATSRFAAVAERNGRSATVLRAMAAEDHTLWLDRCGKAFYVEPVSTAPAGNTDDTEAPVAEQAGSTLASATATVPLSQTFSLQSRPGAQRTIYLDFKGESVTNTAWNVDYGSTITAPPYSNGGAVSTAFSDDELTQIQKAWQVVAEDYAPFDVNVTTKDPGSAAIDRTNSNDTVYGTRVVITSGGAMYDDCSCGGIAYVNVFNSAGTSHGYYQPAWVFTAGAGTSGKNVGEAAAHEAGHNFGLSHDAAAGSLYYSGSAPWAPIMGAGYGQPVTQWSRGEYANATQFQDDLAIIATGAPLRTDDYGDTAGTAQALLPGLPLNGVITARSDVDAFSFTAAGSTTLSVGPAAGLPDLDVKLTVKNAAGNLVATVNPHVARSSAAVATGLGATWIASLPKGGGTYTAYVDGIGTGDPIIAGNYSDYASLGNYQIALATQASSVVTATSSNPPDATAGSAYSASPVSVSGGTAPYAFDASGLPAGLGMDSSTGQVTGTPNEIGSFAVDVTVTDSDYATETASFTVTVAAAAVTGPATVADQTISATAGEPLSAQLAAAGGNGAYSWSTGSMPSGFSVSADGVVTGTPASAGNYSFNAYATSNATTDRGVVRIEVAAAPMAWRASSAPALGTVTAGQRVDRTLSIRGGGNGLRWTHPGALPRGLLLLPALGGRTADLVGIPTKAGSYAFTLKVAGTDGETVKRRFTLRVR